MRCNYKVVKNSIKQRRWFNIYYTYLILYIIINRIFLFTDNDIDTHVTLTYGYFLYHVMVT